MKGTLPPGVSMPLHSHADAESFYVLSGEAQALVQAEGGLERQTLRQGDFIHIAGGTKHTWQTIGERLNFPTLRQRTSLTLCIRGGLLSPIKAEPPWR